MKIATNVITIGIFSVVIAWLPVSSKADDVLGKTYDMNTYYSYTLNSSGSISQHTGGVDYVRFYLSKNGRVFYSDASKVQGLGEGGIATVLGSRKCAANRTIDNYINCIAVSRRGNTLSVVFETIGYYQGRKSYHDTAQFRVSVQDNHCAVTGFDTKHIKDTQTMTVNSLASSSCKSTEGESM